MSKIPLHWDRAELGDSVTWLEEAKPLSESILWNIQETFYKESGIAAWDIVPMFITNNPLLAQHYARLVLNFVRDNLHQFESTAPINIIELGAGAGRFTFLLLQEMERLRPYFPELATLQLRVIVTDFSEKLLDYWLNNPRLKPFFDNGTLDAAKYSPLHEDSIQLAYSGECLNAGSMKNPCLLVANYYFDTIPHDLFVMSPDEALQEVRVAPFVRDTHEGPMELNQVELLLEAHDITLPYYDNHPDWDAVLNLYDNEFRPGSEVIIPTATLETIEALRKLSPRGVAIITTDKGILANTYMFLRSKHYTDITAYIPPLFGLTLHGGAFSVGVNFHALKVIAEAHGGVSFNTDQFNSYVHTAFLWIPGTPNDQWQLNACQYHFYEHLTRYNTLNSLIKLTLHFELPDNGDVDRHTDLHGLMALFQASNYDPYMLKRYSNYLDSYGEFSFFEGLELEAHMDKMLKNQYTIEHTDHCGLVFGQFYRKINRPHKAIDALQQSLKLFDANSDILSLLALCYSDIGDYTSAINYGTKALTMINAGTPCPEVSEILNARLALWQELISATNTA